MTQLYNPLTAKVPAYHLIGDQKLTDGVGTLAVRRPSDGQTHSDLPEANAEIVDRAVGAARAASGVWATMKPRQRGRLMRAWADLTDAHRDELATLEAPVSSLP